MAEPIRGVLFDLDGTLLDTAQDLVRTLNRIRSHRALPEWPIEEMRNIANQGSKAILKEAFGLEEDSSQIKGLREEFLADYEEHLADHTQFFPNVLSLLDYLDENKIPWGIVTNKLTQHTHPLLKTLKIADRAHSVVCGDTLATAKPDPAPILHACQLLDLDPKHCLYLGDAEGDVIASKAAGALSLVALYGYIGRGDDPARWKADGYINDPLELIPWLKGR